MQPGEVLIVQVAFDHFMWWSIPWHTSHDLYQKHLQGEVAAYEKDGVEYVFDFAEKSGDKRKKSTPPQYSFGSDKPR